MAAPTAASHGDCNGRLRFQRPARCARRERHQVLGLVPQRGLEEVGRRPGHGRPAPVWFLVVTKGRRVSSRKVRVDCEAASEAISARLDGEELPIASRDLDAHLAGCPACRDFEAQVANLGRQVDLTSARPVPEDLVAALMAMVEPSSPPVRMDGQTSAPTCTRPGWASRVQWAGATVPALVAVVAISMGAGSHLHLVPTRPPSPCTAGLAVHHAARGG